MPRSLSAKAVAAHALSLPEAWEDHPWGDTVAKVGKKVFAFLGESSLSVKLPESAPVALSFPGTSPTGYGLGRAGWVSIDLAVEGAPSRDLMRGWVEESYRAIAPRRLVRLLDGG